MTNPMDFNDDDLYSLVQAHGRLERTIRGLTQQLAITEQENTALRAELDQANEKLKELTPEQISEQVTT